MGGSLDREIKYRHIRQTGAVEVPDRAAVAGVVNAAVSAGVKMARIRRINHKRIHRNIGNAAAVDRGPRDGAGAGVIEISCLPNMLAQDAVAIKNDIGGVRIVWVDNGAGVVFSGHTNAGHIDHWIAPAYRRKDFPAVEPDQAHVVIGSRNTDRADVRGERLADDSHRIASVNRSIEFIRAEVNRLP